MYNPVCAIFVRETHLLIRFPNNAASQHANNEMGLQGRMKSLRWKGWDLHGAMLSGERATKG